MVQALLLPLLLLPEPLLLLLVQEGAEQELHQPGLGGPQIVLDLQDHVNVVESVVSSPFLASVEKELRRIANEGPVLSLYLCMIQYFTSQYKYDTGWGDNADETAL